MTPILAILGLVGSVLILATLGILVLLAFEIWMIISAVTNTHISDGARVLWVIGILLIHPIVAIIYYFTDYQKTKTRAA
jgi:hypothetical protein